MSEEEFEQLGESESILVGKGRERVRVTLCEYGENSKRPEGLRDRFASLNSEASVGGTLRSETMELALGARTSSAISVVGRRSLTNSSSWSVSIEGNGGGILEP